MLSLHHLAVGYGKNILLENISASVEKSALIGLLGVNGIGKSTLLKAIAGLLKPIHGTVNIAHENIQHFSFQKKATFVSIAGTEREYIPFMSVKEFIQLGRYRFENNFSLQSFSKECNQIICQLSLENIADKSIGEISDGEKQKAIVARALSQNTVITLLDEPTAFLDFKNKEFVFSKLRQIAEEENKIIIVSTHDLEFAFKHCHLWWIINEERKFETMTTARAARDFLISQ